jgi:hypothetical protein
VRRAQSDNYPTVFGDRGQGRHRQRVGPLQVVEEQQAVTYAGTHRLGQQRRLV